MFVHSMRSPSFFSPCLWIMCACIFICVCWDIRYKIHLHRTVLIFICVEHILYFLLEEMRHQHNHGSNYIYNTKWISYPGECMLAGCFSNIWCCDAFSNNFSSVYWGSTVKRTFLSVLFFFFFFFHCSSNSSVHILSFLYMLIFSQEF